jgi:ectoine hydroxylase-related dioxygenase (phytanoyl-CoA dioxygenase family)
MNIFNNEIKDFLFTKEFNQIDTNKIAEELKKNGYFSFPKAFNKNAISLIEKDATKFKLNINNNEICGVHAERQYHLTNLLCVSKTFFDFVTSNFVFEVCRKYLGSEFRLKALRYYETYGGHHMQWHTDNKTDLGFAHIPGIIIIFYISDVEDGQFQYIEGSHLWSAEKKYSDYKEEFIDREYKDKIRDFKLPSGSIIIYNTYGIHRAKPVNNKSFVRKSVFVQVDSEINDGEPIILNSKYITKMNDDVGMFLGFGKPSNYKVHPSTSINSLPLSKNILAIFLRYFVYRFMRKVYDLCPYTFKSYIKKIIR